MNPNKQIENGNPTDNLVNINTIPVNKDYLNTMKEHNAYIQAVKLLKDVLESDTFEDGLRTSDYLLKKQIEDFINNFDKTI